MLKRAMCRHSFLLALVTGLVVAMGVTAPAASAAPTVPAPPASAARPVDPIAHDPTMAKEGGYYYVIITGDSGSPHTYLPMKRSKDLVHWTELGPVFANLPAWIPATLGVTPADAWAPDLTYVNGHWALYYAASQFGTENSVIALATSKTLDPSSPDYGWVDQGQVVRSQAGERYNAIDPEYTTDATGGAWLAYGSFYGGIAMRRLDAATGRLAVTDTTVYNLASRITPDAEEGASITYHGGYYYLFVAFDFCCRALNSDYRVMVGRSKSVTGPYVDQAGVAMTNGGGTEVLRGYNEFIGTGGADVYASGGVDYFVNHYYDATDNGVPRLNVRLLSFPGGWPTVSDPLNPSRSVGHGDAYLKIVSRSNGGVVEDASCGYEGSNIQLWTDLGNTCQQWQFVARGNGASSILNHFSNKVAEVAACNNVDGGNVAQWGWLGFLPNNDCQRWTSVAAADGWTTIQSVLPGARVMDAAGCGSGPGTNIDVTTRSDTACQQFRFEPVGPVLLADPDSVSGEPVVGGCGFVQPLGTTGRVPAVGGGLAGCQQWKFSSVGGAAYTVTNALTGLPLTNGRCQALKVNNGRIGVDADQLCVQWTLVPANDGAWKLSNVGTGATFSVKLLIP